MAVSSADLLSRAAFNKTPVRPAGILRVPRTTEVRPTCCACWSPEGTVAKEPWPSPRPVSARPPDLAWMLQAPRSCRCFYGRRLRPKKFSLACVYVPVSSSHQEPPSRCTPHPSPGWRVRLPVPGDLPSSQMQSSRVGDVALSPSARCRASSSEQFVQGRVEAKDRKIKSSSEREFNLEEEHRVGLNQLVRPKLQSDEIMRCRHALTCGLWNGRVDALPAENDGQAGRREQLQGRADPSP